MIILYDQPIYSGVIIMTRWSVLTVNVAHLYIGGISVNQPIRIETHQEL